LRVAKKGRGWGGIKKDLGGGDRKEGLGKRRERKILPKLGATKSFVIIVAKKED